MSFGYTVVEMNRRCTDAVELLRCAADTGQAIAHVALELESLVVTMAIAEMWAKTTGLEMGVGFEAKVVVFSREILLEAALRLEQTPDEQYDVVAAQPSAPADARPARGRSTRRSAAAGYSRRRSAPAAAAG